MTFKGLKRKYFTEKWDEAFPIGNGIIGGLVFGKPLHTVIATNHEELFVPMPDNSEARPFNGAKYLEKTRELLFEGKYEEATRFYIDSMKEDGWNGNLIWTNPFETTGEIHFDFSERDITDYCERLDFRTGENAVSFKENESLFSIRSFVSRSRNVLAVLISNDNDSSFSIDISVTDNKEIHHIKEVKRNVSDNMVVTVSEHSEEESGYISAAMVVNFGGEINAYANGAGFYVNNTHKILVLYSVSPWKNKAEAEKAKLLRALKDIPKDYDKLLKEHVLIHKEMFERVSVEFSDSEVEYTNDELKCMCTNDTLSPLLLERMTDMGRYLEIASFGNMPPNLQGVWSGTTNPPWSADYTLDENIQMMMWQVMPGGLWEFARKYFDWLESFSEDFAANAKAYYGCNGILAAPRISSNGYTRHFIYEWPMCFWTAGAGWLSQLYRDYYEYTKDISVYERGVNYWMRIVEFYEDFLIEGEDGKYIFAPSYSPENTPLTHTSPTAINATMDIAIAKEVYSSLIDAVKVLGICGDKLSRWESEYSKLPDYAVNEDKALKEWTPKYLKDDYHHRHSSHLYPVFPGREALYEGNEALFDACHEAARLRLIDGVEAISGWGLAHLAGICARLKDADLWYSAMNRLIQVFTLDNLFTSHNPGFLFQIDANMGITAAVYEMMAYSDNEVIQLFPIISPKLRYICVKGLQLRSQVRVDILEKEGEWLRAVLTNSGKSVMRVVCPKGYSLENGDTEIDLMPMTTLEINGYFRESQKIEF